jgi:hypothetical protein
MTGSQQNVMQMFQCFRDNPTFDVGLTTGICWEDGKTISLRLAQFQFGQCFINKKGRES